MKLIVEDDEIEEILIEDIIKSDDKGKVIIKGEEQGKRGEGIDEMTKEIIGLDAIALGPTEAAKIHGVSISRASRYGNGNDIKDPEVIEETRAGIAELATEKLMESLGLFQPSQIDKPIEQIKAASALASIVEKVTNNGEKNSSNVHLHLYSPKQKTVEKYDVIDV